MKLLQHNAHVLCAHHQRSSEKTDVITEEGNDLFHGRQETFFDYFCDIVKLLRLNLLTADELHLLEMYFSFF